MGGGVDYCLCEGCRGRLEFESGGCRRLVEGCQLGMGGVYFGHSSARVASGLPGLLFIASTYTGASFDVSSSSSSGVSSSNRNPSWGRVCVKRILRES